MAFSRKNDEAVSPVIGVILMVAITVILAAVIAAFVFGMSGNIQKTRIVAATATQPDANHIIITYNGGQDDSTLVNINVTAPNGTLFWTSNAKGNLVSTGTIIAKPSVGANLILTRLTTGTLPGDTWTGSDHVVVVGAFSDGANQVIMDTYV